MSRNAIAIDFGTSNSRVAVVVNGNVHIIKNDYGNQLTPSCVGFSGDQILVGEDAENRGNLQSRNTVFDAKRLIGRMPRDEDVQSLKKHWPFKVVLGDEGLPMVDVELSGATKHYTPQEISGMVLKNMKARALITESAEGFLGSPVTDAVISVPAMFNQSHRLAVKEAATSAGLNVLRVMSSTALATFACHFGGVGRDCEERNVLIFDLGGGNLEVSVVTMEDGIFQVKSVAGDCHLGGQDFTNRMIDHFVAEFRRCHKKGLTSDPRALSRLRTACERAKRTLSTSTKAAIELDFLFDGIDFYTSITRKRFEGLCADLFSSVEETVVKALGDARLNRTDIHEIVTIGGSSRIPKVHQLLNTLFPLNELSTRIDPDTATVYGAAVQAAILSGDRSSNLNDLLLIDVVPVSLGVKIAEGKMCTIIPRNTIIPTKTSRTFTTSCDDQTFVLVEIYEGENLIAAENHLLGKLRLSGKLEVIFSIDNSNMLTVTATNAFTGKKIESVITAGLRSRQQKIKVEVE